MPFAGELPPSPGGLVCARLLNSAPGLTRRRSHEASGKSHRSPTRTDHRAVSSPVPGLRSLVRLSTRGASSLRVQLAATARLLGGRTASASAYGRRCTSPGVGAPRRLLTGSQTPDSRHERVSGTWSQPTSTCDTHRHGSGLLRLTRFAAVEGAHRPLQPARDPPHSRRNDARSADHPGAAWATVLPARLRLGRTLRRSRHRIRSRSSRCPPVAAGSLRRPPPGHLGVWPASPPRAAQPGRCPARTP
jgi:hypothetical protein